MRKVVMAAAMTALLTGAAPALAEQMGAPVAQPTQPGAWGPQGWQAGGTTPGYATPTYATPTYAAPTYAAPAPAPAYAAPAQPGFGPAMAPSGANYAGPAPLHVYDKIARGRKVKGPAAEPVNNVADPATWGLPQPPAGMRWIRYYDEALLLDANDRTIDIRAVAWNAPRPAPVPAYAGGAYPAPMGPVRAPGTYRSRYGSVTTVTQVLPPPAMIGAAYGPYGGQVVSVTPGTITTTTRTYWVNGGASHYHRAHRRCGCRR